MKKLYIISLILLTIFYGCLQETQVSATVLSHAVTTNRYGDRTYTTIFKTDDGYIQEVTGLEYYVLPIGDKTTLKVYRKKK